MGSRPVGERMGREGRGGVWGLDGWQVLAAAGVPQRRVVSEAGVVVGKGTGRGDLLDRGCGRCWRRLEQRGAGECVEWGVWGQDGGQDLALAGAPRRRVVGGAGVVAVGGTGDREEGIVGQGSGQVLAAAGLVEGGVWGQDGWQVLAAAGAPRRRVVDGVFGRCWRRLEHRGAGGCGG